MADFLKNSALVLIAMGLLAGCGGSGTTRFEALNAERVTVFEEFIEDATPLDLTTLSAQGSAVYAGGFLAFGGIGGNDPFSRNIRTAFIGEANITVDFADQSLAGSVDQFQEIANAPELGPQFTDAPLEQGKPAEGSLTIGGVVSASDTEVFDVTLSGELTEPGGASLLFGNVPGIAAVFGPDYDALAVRGGTNGTFDGQAGYIAYSTNLPRVAE